MIKDATNSAPPTLLLVISLKPIAYIVQISPDLKLSVFTL